jgi:hypothetical protein
VRGQIDVERKPGSSPGNQIPIAAICLHGRRPIQPAHPDADAVRAPAANVEGGEKMITSSRHAPRQAHGSEVDHA